MIYLYIVEEKWQNLVESLMIFFTIPERRAERVRSTLQRTVLTVWLNLGEIIVYVTGSEETLDLLRSPNFKPYGIGGQGSQGLVQGQEHSRARAGMPLSSPPPRLFTCVCTSPNLLVLAKDTVPL